MRNRIRRASGWVSAIGLGITAIGGAVPAAAHGPGSPSAGSHWASWLGSATADTPTTLAQVRTIIGAGTGAAAGLTGKGVGVALIDTGVAPIAGLPAANLVNGPDLSLESPAPNLRYLDTFGHGTHMAGIIVGNDTTTGTKGLAPDVKLTSIKVGTANGTVDVSQVIAAVDWVVEHRNDDPANPIKIINLSYGSGGTPAAWNDPLGFAVEKAWQSGVLVVAAAGNDGNGAGSLANPASDEWILSVGAAATKGTATTADDELTSFTNLPTGGKQINVLAPGVSIVSLRDAGSSIDTAYPTARVGTTLFRGSGTSQAAAVTTAAAALLLQARPAATPDQLKDLLVKSATYIPNGAAATLGLKEINVNAALARSAAVVPQTWSKSTGAGTLDNARGSSRVMFDNAPLSGQRSVWGPLPTATWVVKAAAGSAWSGGVWMGYRLTGDGWTGTSWAARTWAAAAWSNSSPWTSAAGASWTDPGWAGRSWTGRSWTAGTWSSRSWSSDDWSSAYWG